MTKRSFSKNSLQSRHSAHCTASRPKSWSCSGSRSQLYTIAKVVTQLNTHYTAEMFLLPVNLVDDKVCNHSLPSVSLLTGTATSYTNERDLTANAEWEQLKKYLQSAGIGGSTLGQGGTGPKIFRVITVHKWLNSGQLDTVVLLVVASQMMRGQAPQIFFPRTAPAYWLFV